MPTINPALPADGDDVTGPSVSVPLAAIISLLGGNLDTDNIAPGGIQSSDLATNAKDGSGFTTLLQGGWVPVASSIVFTRTGNLTMTATGDVRSALPVGNKVQLDNSGTKYFHVASSSFATGTTTFTLYSVNNSALVVGSISNVYRSTAVNPDGFPIGATGLGSTCSIYKSSDQTVGNASWLAITFNAEDSDTDGLHDNATNNQRITVKHTGWYDVTWAIAFAGSATGLRGSRLVVNGTTVVRNGNWMSGNAGGVTLVGAVTVFLTAGDYINIDGYQDSGGNLTAFSGLGSCFLKAKFNGQVL